MAYRVQVERDNCLNCGVCMDVCSIHGLDMTRTAAPTMEPDGAIRKAWMMEFPIQTGRCTGCQLCVLECPMEAVHVLEVDEEPEVAPPQGLIFQAPPDRPGWVPLSTLTRENRKIRQSDPWGRLTKWRLARRQGPWQVWRTWPGPNQR